jgi:hypothetical protein
MSRQRIGVGAVVFLVAIMCPRMSSADMIDVLWKMSGPQLISLASIEYRVPLADGGLELIKGIVKNDNKTLTLWDVVPLIPRPAADSLDISSAGAKKNWFAVAANVYASTSRDANATTPYDGWQVKMLAIEPRFDRLLHAHNCLAVYAGAGISYDRLWGNGFSNFDKFAFKIRPVGVMLLDTVDLAFNIRIYPNGFTHDEFTETTQSYSRPYEIVYGFSGGIAWSKKSK